jgi:hypothetical protein
MRSTTWKTAWAAGKESISSRPRQAGRNRNMEAPFILTSRRRPRTSPLKKP